MSTPFEQTGPERDASSQPKSGAVQSGSGGADRAFGPRTIAECLTSLIAVLTCLDVERPSLPAGTEETLSLAAAHVQQSIELIQAIEEGDA